jgi:hypothetical protein
MDISGVNKNLRWAGEQRMTTNNSNFGANNEYVADVILTNVFTETESVYYVNLQISHRKT